MPSPLATGTAWPRVGLLGNPSDGLGGRVIAFTFDAFRVTARVTADPAGPLLVHGAGAARRRQPLDLEHRERQDGIAALVAAALRVGRERGVVYGPGTKPPGARFDRPAVAVEVVSDVPRQAGLSGSSAVVIATVRALDAWVGASRSVEELAEAAYRAEVDVLGIAGGGQDKVVQAVEGLVDMDFASGVRPEQCRWERLDPTLLPALYLAHGQAAGAPSGVAHGALQARAAQGDPALRGVVEDLRAIARAGREALLAGDHVALHRLIDANLEARRRVWTLGDDDLAMISLGRAAGAAVKLSGSGGAVLGMPRDPGDMQRLADAHRAAGLGFVALRAAAPGHRLP